MVNSVKWLAVVAMMSVLTACQNRLPTPEPRYVPNIVLQDSQVLEILPHRGVCNSASPMQCLLVKKQGATEGEIFGIGYNHILGFEPKVGVAYKIRVSQEMDKNTNQPTGFWHLEEILSQHIQ